MPTAVLAAGLLAGQTRVLGSYWDSPSVTGSPKGTVRKDSAKGTLMQELRLVAVSEDGSYAVLVVPGRSGRFALPIDERLRTVARGQFSRLAQYEIEVESPLRPKEIQDRIRAGETAEEIADASGLPVDRIRRFEGPVLAEREFRAKEAQHATVRARGDSGPGPRLAEIVAERLAAAGAGADEVEWDSRKRQDGSWQVQLAYTVGGRMHLAEWVYDPRSKHVTPDDDEAVRLCLGESDWPEPRSAARAGVTATVTPIGSRASSTGAHPSYQAHQAEQRSQGDWPSGRDALTSSRQGQAGSGRPRAAQGNGREAAGTVIADDEVAAGAGKPSGVGPAPVQPAAGEAAVGPAARQGRRSSGGRPRRSSVPSWDEIMLGNSRQPD